MNTAQWFTAYPATLRVFRLPTTSSLSAHVQDTLCTQVEQLREALRKLSLTQGTGLSPFRGGPGYE